MVRSIKTFIFACAWCLLGAGSIRADVTVVLKIEGRTQNLEGISKFKNGRLRLDDSPGTGLIEDAKTDERMTLLHASKTYTSFVNSVPWAREQSLNHDEARVADYWHPLTATGRKAAISGFLTDEYTRTVVSVNTQSIPDSEFEIPAGYAAVTSPVLNPPAAGGPSPSPSR